MYRYKKKLISEKNIKIKNESKNNIINKKLLLNNINKIHTTVMGFERIKKNLSLGNIDVVEWCKLMILKENALIIRKGKNWYVTSGDCVITVNASSYTIITAKKIK